MANETRTDSDSKVTTDHEEIRRWVQERGGHPATVRGTRDSDETGVLRINFPGYEEDSLEKLTWKKFFEQMEEKRLAFLYQDKTKDGKESRFFKFIKRED